MDFITLAASLACVGLLFFVILELNRSHQRHSRNVVRFKIQLTLIWIDQNTGGKKMKNFNLKGTYVPRENEYIHVHYDREADKYGVPIGAYKVKGVHYETERGELIVSVHATSTERGA